MHSLSVSSSSAIPVNAQNHVESSVASTSSSGLLPAPISQAAPGSSTQSNSSGHHSSMQPVQIPPAGAPPRSPSYVPSRASQQASPSREWWRNTTGKTGITGVQTPPLSASSNPRTVPPTIVQSRLSSETRSTEQPIGSCPGGGHCNGQGGKAVCTGCPAFNNRYRVISAGSAQTSEGQPNGSQTQTVTIVPREAVATIPAIGPEPAGTVSGLGIDTRPPHLNSGQDSQSTQSQGTEVSAMACENCGTRTTPLWRRDGEGRVACNACGRSFSPRDPIACHPSAQLY